MTVLVKELLANPKAAANLKSLVGTITEATGIKAAMERLGDLPDNFKELKNAIDSQTNTLENAIGNISINTSTFNNQASPKNARANLDIFYPGYSVDSGGHSQLA